MNRLSKKIKDEVVVLMAGCGFSARTGAYLEGKLVGVEIVSKKWNRTSLCDLHFRVIPARISPAVPTEVFAGARKAAVEAQFDRNPNVRFAAHHFLQSLRDEPASHANLEGMSVQLHFRDEGDEKISLEGRTDRNGEIWFRDVLETAICSLTFEQRVSTLSEEFFNAAEEARRRAETRSLRAEPSSDPLSQIQLGSEPHIMYLADRRIVVLLEEIVGGKAVLTLETNAKEFSGTTVRFEWGNETGEIVLEPGVAPGRWGGQRKLNESFKKLELTIPTFEVIPR